MNCKCCSAALPDDSIFCPYCGTPVGSTSSAAPEAPAPEPTPVPVAAAPVPEAPTPLNQNFCAHCGATMPVGSRFCGSCGKEDPAMAPPAIAVEPPVVPPVYAAPAEPATPGPEKPKKKRKALKIVLPIIAGVLVLALVIGLLTNWFGFYGPGAKIINAAKKTLGSENFTVEITRTYDYGNGEYSGSATMTYEVAIDFEKEELTIVGLNEDDEIEAAIYDGWSISYYDGTYEKGYYAIDISDTIDKFFEAYENTGDLDLEDLLKDLDEDMYDEIDDMMRMEELEKSVKSLYRKLNSNSWLKENAGYSKEKVDGVTVYTFEPDLYDLSCAVMEELEGAFRDEDDYEDLMDELKDGRSDMRDIDAALSLGVKSGKLVSFEFSTETDSYSVSMEAEFRNIGSTNVDSDTLEEILEEAERW